MPAIPESTRSSIILRLLDHAEHNWPQLAKVQARAAIDDLDERIAGKVARWQREAGLLTTIPGFGDVVAWAWLGEIGPAPHLWFSPATKSSPRG